VQFRWKDETPANPRDDLQAALRQTQLLTMADDNRDGKLQESELRTDSEEGASNVTSDGVAPVHQQFKANFAAIDADKDGGLSMQELGAAMEQMQRGRSR
jgi:hypothetical protein